MGVSSTSPRLAPASVQPGDGSDVAFGPLEAAT